MSTFTRSKISSLLRFSIPIGFAVLGLLAIMARGAEPAGNIRGIVKDEQGAPLVGVKVQMCGLEKLQNGTWHRELRLESHRLVLHDGAGEAYLPGSGKRLPCDWELDIAPDMHRDTNYIMEVHFWTGGKIPLDKVTIPKNVEVAKAK